MHTKKQNKYWPSLELLLNTQSQWANHHHPKPKLVFSILQKQLGLDIDKLKKDMEDPRIKDIILQDSKDLKLLNVSGTPTFFVNGRAPKEFGIKALEELIREEITKLY